MLIEAAKKVNAWIDRGGDPSDYDNAKVYARVLVATFIGVVAMFIAGATIVWAVTHALWPTVITLAVVCGPGLYKGIRWILTDYDKEER